MQASEDSAFVLVVCGPIPQVGVSNAENHCLWVSGLKLRDATVSVAGGKRSMVRKRFLA